jgi:sugar fermentation stimulation protein A
MLGCSDPGSTIYLSLSANVKRKYPYSWELIELAGGLGGVNTALPNKIAKIALEKGAIRGLPKGPVKSEVRVGESRLDFRLGDGRGPWVYVEVKNCSYVKDGVAYFPDAKSARGVKHLHALLTEVEAGNRGALLICVQRPDARFFAPADFIDPIWGATLRRALAGGVELYVREIRLSPLHAILGKEIPARIEP